MIYNNKKEKVKSPSEKKPKLLAAIKMRSQDYAGNLNNYCEVVPSLHDKEIKDAQNKILNSVGLRIISWTHRENNI